MNFIELVEKSNERVIELNKTAKELEAISDRLELITREGNRIAIEQGDNKPFIKIADLMTEEAAAGIMEQIIKAITDKAADKKRRMEELLGIPVLNSKPADPKPEPTDWQPLDTVEEPVVNITPAKNAQKAPQSVLKNKANILPRKEEKANVEDVEKREHVSGNELNNMFAAGCSNDEIMAATGLKPASVKKYRGNYNKFGNAQGKEQLAAPKEEAKNEEAKNEKMDPDKVREMINEGTPLKDIAVYYNVLKPDVYQFCKKHRIPTKKECAR